MSKNLSKILKEVQEYEKQKIRQAMCGKVTVRALNNIVINGVEHAGVASCICNLTDNHVGDCACGCGHHWIGGAKR